MIEWWDQRIQDNPQLASLAPDKLRLFAVACVYHSFTIVYDYIKKQIDAAEVESVHDAVNYCWRHRQKSNAPAKTQRIRSKIAEFYQDAEGTEFNHTWSNIVGAVTSVLDALVGEDLVEDVLNASSCAYEAVRWMVFNEAYDRGHYRPPKVKGFTANHHAMKEYAERFYLSQTLCVDEIEFQERCIERLSGGQNVGRS